VNVPYQTCVDASTAARGTITTSSAVALATVLHETFDRQGAREQANDLCLGAVGVWQAVNRHAGTTAANHAFTLVQQWYASHLTTTAAHRVQACASQLHAVWNG
jgi:hypothetical protein